MNVLRALILGITVASVLNLPAWAQIPDPASPDPELLRPIDAYDSVFIEELTWLEVRDAMRSGKTTIIIATGGIEQNGPYLALGKHNYILRATTEAIACINTSGPYFGSSLLINPKVIAFLSTLLASLG